jgi:phosphoribosyl-ATP pyrophosphohydrolase/phosphoribosyl-AMP cyclohydrolase
MTDRQMRGTNDLTRVTFDGAGLVPVIAQDAETGAVLMMAWANMEALEATMSTGQLHFYSRSRAELWKKGETSGNTLSVRALHLDCDADTVLALVDPAGPACHTGEVTCFGDLMPPGPDGSSVLTRLDAALAQRAESRPEGSYTVRLLDDENLRLKKLGEETAELVAALAVGDAARATEEAADLLYHSLVGLRALGVSAREMLGVLESRE